MNKMIRLSKFLFSLLVLTPACDDIIEYSPYQAGTGEEKEKSNITAVENLTRQSTDDFEPFTIALIGDNHFISIKPGKIKKLR